eukprot:gene11460-34171_t
MDLAPCRVPHKLAPSRSSAFGLHHNASGLFLRNVPLVCRPGRVCSSPSQERHDRYQRGSSQAFIAYTRTYNSSNGELNQHRGAGGSKTAARVRFCATSDEISAVSSVILSQTPHGEAPPSSSSSSTPVQPHINKANHNSSTSIEDAWWQQYNDTSHSSTSSTYEHGSMSYDNEESYEDVAQPRNNPTNRNSSASIEDAWWQQYNDTSLSSSYEHGGGESYEDVDMEEGGASSLNSDRSATGPPSAPATSKATYEVLKLDASGKYRLVHKDLLREHRIQPRDLRRIDPSVDFNKTSPSITIKENVLLICIGGVRAIATAYKALLFEPTALATRQFFDIVVPHLRARGDSGVVSAKLPPGQRGQEYGVSHSEYMSQFYGNQDPDKIRTPPFEMEVLEGALLVATGNQDADKIRTPPFEMEVLEGALLEAIGQLDAEMTAVTQRVQSLLANLPRDINPVNLEELRRVKSVLVELETKADTVRKILEELMDDDDELRELNLSSRPRREERRRQRERKKLEQELERAQELKEEIEDQYQLDDEGSKAERRTRRPSTNANGHTFPHSPIGGGPRNVGSQAMGKANSSSSRRYPTSSSAWPKQERVADLKQKYDKERLAELRSKFGLDRRDQMVDGSMGFAEAREDRESRWRGDNSEQSWIE